MENADRRIIYTWHNYSVFCDVKINDVVIFMDRRPVVILEKTSEATKKATNEMDID